MFIDEAALKPEANNLTLVRLVLASAVIVTHCYWLVTGVAGRDALSDWLGVPLSVYAVDGFFFLSGFLVYPSLVRRGELGSFVLARLARLWPGLAVAVLGTALAGLAVTRATPGDYFGGETARFVITNLGFVGGHYTLTGVMCGDAPCNVNGSLWTLPWEARCYAGLAALFALGLAGRERMIRLVLPATLVGALLWDVPAIQALAGRLGGAGAVYLLGIADRLWFLFAAGIAASLFRDRIRLSWWVLLLLFAINLAAHRLGLGLHVRATFVGYAVLCCGFLSARGGAIAGRWPDYSYGVYIYAFPVMMAIAALWPAAPYAALTAANFVATLALAAISWHCVERPALEMVRHRKAKTRAAEAV